MGVEAADRGRVLLLVYTDVHSKRVVGYSRLCSTERCGASGPVQVSPSHGVARTTTNQVVPVAGVRVRGATEDTDSAVAGILAEAQLTMKLSRARELQKLVCRYQVANTRADRSSHSSESRTKTKPPSSAQAALLEWNPCDAMTDRQTCHGQEHCEWTATQGGPPRCQALPIDYATQKMAVQRARVSEKFLDLVQRSAVDFYAFQELHDDRSRAQFERQPRPTDTLPSFMDAAIANAGDIVRGGETLDTVECATKSTDQCRASPYCFVNQKTRKCAKKRIGTNHGRCAEYHGRSQQSCMQDPMCMWRGSTDNTLHGMFQTGPSCHNRYLSELGKHKHAIALHTAANAGTAHHYIVYPLTESTDTTAAATVADKQRVHALLAQQPTSEAGLLRVLVELQHMIEMSGAAVREHATAVHAFLAASRSATPAVDAAGATKGAKGAKGGTPKKKGSAHNQHATVHIPSHLWKSARVARRLVGIRRALGSVESSNNTDDCRVTTTTLFSTAATRQFNLHEMHKKSKFMHYSFHVTVGGDELFFHSTERPDAPVALVNLSRTAAIEKVITILNITARVTFLLDHRACVRGVQIEASRTGERSRAAEVPLPVMTTLLDKSGQRVLLQDCVDCHRTWELHGLGYPLPTNAQGDAISSHDAPRMSPDMVVNINACNYRWQSDPTFMPPHEWRRADAMGSKSVKGRATKKRSVQRVVQSGQECETATDCLDMAAEQCPSARFGVNPMRCARGAKFWQKNCALRPTQEQLYEG